MRKLGITVALLLAISGSLASAADLDVYFWLDVDRDGLPTDEPLDQFGLSSPIVLFHELLEGRLAVYSNQTEAGYAQYTDLPDGRYHMTAPTPPAWIVVPTTPEVYSFSITNGVVSIPGSTLFFGYSPTTGMEPCLFCYDECSSTQGSKFPDGRHPQEGWYTDQIESVQVSGQCCNQAEATATVVLRSNVLSHVSVVWSTGATGLTAMLPSGSHTVYVTNLDSGAVSQDTVTLTGLKGHLSSQSRALGDSFELFPSYGQRIRGVLPAGCSTNGSISSRGLARMRDLYSIKATLQPGGVQKTYVNNYFQGGSGGFEAIQFGGLTSGTYRIELELTGNFAPLGCPVVYEFVVPDHHLVEAHAFADSAATVDAFSVVPPSCAPNATTTSSWVSLTPQSGSVQYALQPNPNPGPRVAEIEMDGQAFTIVQHGTEPVEPRILAVDPMWSWTYLLVEAMDDRTYRIEGATNLMTSSWTVLDTGNIGSITPKRHTLGLDDVFFLRAVWE